MTRKTIPESEAEISKIKIEIKSMPKGERKNVMKQLLKNIKEIIKLRKKYEEYRKDPNSKPIDFFEDH